MASAGAKQEERAKEPPTAQATEALATRLTNEALKNADEGRAKPKGGERNDCPSVRKELKNLKARGIDTTNCIEERSTPPSPGLIDRFMAGLKKQAPLPETVPMANFPAPSGSGEMQVNGLAEYGQLQQAIDPVAASCGVYPQRYLDRYDGCQYYLFDHIILETGTGKVLGVGYFITFDWVNLREAGSRYWNHHQGVYMYEATGAALTSGVYVWMQVNTKGDAQKIDATPADGWVIMRKGQIFHGKATVLSNKNPVGIDYSQQSSLILTYNPAGYNVAVGEPPAMQQVRCDTNAPALMHSGCVFWQVSGTFRLSRTDPNAKESVLFIERAQNFLAPQPGKPGVRPLTRATEVQRLANRAVSGQACKPLLGTIQGYDCDEYPFAATVEGAASGPRYVNWDIALVPSGHNRRVGGLLSAFYQDQRMFYGDHFYVEVGP